MRNKIKRPTIPQGQSGCFGQTDGGFLLSGVVEIMLCLSQDLKTVCVSCFDVCRRGEGFPQTRRGDQFARKCSQTFRQPTDP